MKKIRLECEYCGNIIKEDDSVCPKCGADCSNIIKKYNDQQEEEISLRKEEFNKQRDKIVKSIGLSMSISTIIFFIIFFAVFGVFIYIFISQAVRTEHNRNSNNTIVKNEKQEAKYDVVLDGYEEYQYYHNFFTNCNTKDGFKKIAFKFNITNTGKINISINSYRFIELRADNEEVEKTSLKMGDFCVLKKGKSIYSEIKSATILPNDSLSGYIGYEVPINKSKLKFIINGSKTIEIDNPVYQAN